MAENYSNRLKTACYEQFLLFPQCFQKACFPGASKGVTGNGLIAIVESSEWTIVTRQNEQYLHFI